MKTRDLLGILFLSCLSYTHALVYVSSSFQRQNLLFEQSWRQNTLALSQASCKTHASEVDYGVCVFAEWVCLARVCGHECFVIVNCVLSSDDIQSFLFSIQRNKHSNVQFVVGTPQLGFQYVQETGQVLSRALIPVSPWISVSNKNDWFAMSFQQQIWVGTEESRCVLSDRLGENLRILAANWNEAKLTLAVAFVLNESLLQLNHTFSGQTLSCLNETNTTRFIRLSNTSSWEYVLFDSRVLNSFWLFSRKWMKISYGGMEWTLAPDTYCFQQECMQGNNSKVVLGDVTLNLDSLFKSHQEHLQAQATRSKTIVTLDSVFPRVVFVTWSLLMTVFGYVLVHVLSCRMTKIPKARQ